MFDGKFIQLDTLAHELEEKDILSWLYKDGEDNDRATTMEVAIPTHLYGKGYLIMQLMGYNGKGPIEKHWEGVTEPIDPHSQLAKDKTRLGYEHILPPRKTPSKYQKPQWKAKKKYKEDSWQEALFESAETIRKECEYQERKQNQEKPNNQKKEAPTTEVHHFQAPMFDKEELSPDNIIPPRGEIVYEHMQRVEATSDTELEKTIRLVSIIKDLFSPYNIPVHSTARI